MELRERGADQTGETLAAARTAASPGPSRGGGRVIPVGHTQPGSLRVEGQRALEDPFPWPSCDGCRNPPAHPGPVAMGCMPVTEGRSARSDVSGFKLPACSPAARTKLRRACGRLTQRLQRKQGRGKAGGVTQGDAMHQWKGRCQDRQPDDESQNRNAGQRHTPGHRRAPSVRFLLQRGRKRAKPRLSGLGTRVRKTKRSKTKKKLHFQGTGFF